MKPDRPRAPQTKSRPPGTNCAHLDAALFPVIDGKLTAGEAALQLAKAGLVYSHGGTLDSVARRLARRYLAARCIGIPRQRAGESASLAPMSTATRIRPANRKASPFEEAVERQAVTIKTQGNRITLLERAVGRLQAAQEAAAAVLQSSELLMAETVQQTGQALEVVRAIVRRDDDSLH